MVDKSIIEQINVLVARIAFREQELEKLKEELKKLQERK